MSQDNQETAPEARRPGVWRSRWLWFVLFGSLAINFLVFGVAIGFRYFGHGGPGGRFDIGRGVMSAMKSIPGDRGDEIRNLIRDEIGEGWRRGREQRQLRRDAIDAFVSDPVDREKLTATLDTFARNETMRHERWRKAILRLSEVLTAQERKDLVRSMRRGRWHRGPRRDRPE